jgi:Xaa-Pro aminopeptidase
MQLLLYRGEAFDPNFYYHSGVDIDHSFLIVRGGRRTLFTHRMNEAIARKSFKGRVVAYKDPFDSLARHLKGRTVSVDAASISMGMAKQLRRFCKLRDASGELRKERMVKKPAEVASIRRAVRHTRELLESLDLGAAKTELDLKRQLMVMMAEKGLEPAFDPVVSTGRNTRYPHYVSGKKRLESLVLIDCGVRSNHYCSDLTRCFVLDSDRGKKEQYEKLQDICYAIVDELPSLVKGSEVAVLADELIERAGFPKMIHSIGHGVGLDVHEPPGLGRKSKDRLARTVMAIEPAFYLNSHGMRFEETVYSDGKRSRIL